METQAIMDIFKNFTGILFRGLEQDYDPINLHVDKLYFTLDTNKLLLNNIDYSGRKDIYFVGDITMLTNESSQRIIEILGNKLDFDIALSKHKLIASITSFGILPIEIIKLSSTEYSFTIRFYNLSNVQNRNIIINCNEENWTSIKSVNLLNLIHDLPIKNVDTNIPTSLFIKNENGIIKGKISIDYDTENKLIKILGFNNETISSIDATAFIKDGMINNVQLEENPDGKPIGTYLIITFNTDAGKEPIYLNVTELINIYTSGDGINISNSKISIRIDNNSEDYISVTSNGLKISGINNKINNITPYIINFNLLSKLSENSTEEDIYNALNGTKEFSHDNLYNLLNQLINVPFIVAKDNLSNIPISFTSSSGEYVIQYEYYEIYFSIKIYQSLNVFKIKSVSSFNSFQFTVLGQYIDEVNAKASQSYANLSEIQSSGDKNVNKIYIDNETNTSYRYDAASDSYVNIGATLPDNLAYVEEVASEEPSEQLEFIADKAIKDFEGNVIPDTYATKEELKLKTSEVYANLSAIQSSGETDTNKIYIAGDTLISYIYNGKEFTYLNSVKPKGGYNRALFEAAGAVFNEKTGYYELYADEGGLTDITEEQMCDIYTQTAHLAAMKGENYNLFSLTCRTNFKGRITGNLGINEIFAYGSKSLEILFLDNINHNFSSKGIVVSSFISDDFYNCPKLKKVIGPIRIEMVTKDISYSYSMIIEDIKISGLKVNFQFFAKDSVINYASIKYLVDNAANTSAITITVHPTTYGYLTGTIQPTTQVGGTTEEWQAIVTTAQEKQITFATTE